LYSPIKRLPNEEIRAKCSILTSMEPVVIEMTNLSAGQRGKECGHSEHIDEGQKDEV
jgi:hypothetical protein